MEVVQAAIDLLRSTFPEAYPWLRSEVRVLLGTAPVFLLMAGLILLLEKFRPAVPGQPLLSKGLINDFLWFWVTVAVVIGATKPVSMFLRNDVFEAHLSGLSLDVILKAPVAVQVLLSVVVGDFLAWFHHLVRHKVLLMWQFHAVHHSATEMNFMTNSRGHPLDRVFSRLVVFIPAGILLPAGIAVPVGITWFFLITWYQRFYHANVRMDFGPLRYVLVTPQSHRVHHSILPEHRDCNFGVLFCIWDRLFGTHVDVERDHYPATGIANPEFPMERSYRPDHVLLTFFGQWVYPLLSAGRLLLRPKSEVKAGL